MGLLRKPVLRGGPLGPWRLPIVAIYSLNHSSVGRTTHAAGTAGAHIGYITRSSACLEVLAERMPSAQAGERGGEARAWLDAQEAADRKNARVIDKLMLALPCELNAEQQSALVRSFAESVTEGRAPWFAAIHQDHPENPHAHLVIRDKDLATGKRVVGLSEKGSTDRLREVWERHANLALEMAGRDERIDRRSLKAQGVDREPTIHVGPTAAAIERQGKTVPSQVRTTRRGREVRYPEIDGGKTRSQHNAQIRARAAEKARLARQARKVPQEAVQGLPLGVSNPAAASRPQGGPGGALRAQPIMVVPGTQFEALEAIWNRHVTMIFDQIRERALNLIAKAEKHRRNLLDRHRATEPQAPALKMLEGRRYHEAHAAWEKSAQALLHGRVARINQRIAHLKDYADRQGRGWKLAAEKFGAQQPEFIRTITIAMERDQAAAAAEKAAQGRAAAIAERHELARKIREEREARTRGQERPAQTPALKPSSRDQDRGGRGR